jgi:hypothetical protein
MFLDSRYLLRTGSILNNTYEYNLSYQYTKEEKSYGHINRQKGLAKSFAIHNNDKAKPF